MRDLDSDEIDVLLDLEGSVDASEEDELRDRIEQTRALWRGLS